MWHEKKEIREMLESIAKDGVRYCPARGVIVQANEGGYMVWVDKEEYAWYPDIKAIMPDLLQFKEDRPFPMREEYTRWMN